MTKKIFISCCKWFLLIIFCVVLGVNLLFSAMSQPKDYQTINIFITAESCDKTVIKQASTATECAVYCYSETNTYYESALYTNGMLLCDILVVSQNYLPEKTIEKECAPFDSDFLSSYGIDCAQYTFYEKNGSRYALLVYDKFAAVDVLRGKVNFDSDLKYWLLINIARPNAAPYSAAQNTSDNAFSTLANLLADS